MLTRLRGVVRTIAARARAAGSILASGTLYQSAGSGYRFRGFFAPNTGPTASIVLAADTLRNRCRDVLRNNAWARNLVEVLVANLVGTGFTPHPLFGSGDEGENAKAAAKWVELARMQFRRWAKQAGATGGNLEGVFSLLVRGMVEGGDSFGVRTAGVSAGVALQIRVYEAEMVPLWKNETLPEGFIRAGIEYDEQEQVRAYWFEPEHPGEFVLRRRDRSNVPLVRIPAEDVIHFFRPTRPGQGRGEPWLAPVILRLHDLGGYADAELVRKKAAANHVFKVEAPDPTTISKAIGDLHDENATKNEVDTKPMSVVVMGVGETFDLVEPADVGPNFGAFYTWALREICAGIGVPYGIGTGDMSEEVYTSHRAALNSFWERCDAIQYAVIVPLLNRLWAWWLDEAVTAGVVPAPRYIAWKEDYLDCDWMPPKRHWVDPQKEVGAVGDELELKITSRTRICAARGEDFADIVRELAEEERLMRDAGMQPMPVERSRRAIPADEQERQPPRTGTDG